MSLRVAHFTFEPDRVVNRNINLLAWTKDWAVIILNFNLRVIPHIINELAVYDDGGKNVQCESYRFQTI